MRTGLRIIRRKTRTRMPQLAGLVLLMAVGVCFFITLFTISVKYEETAEEYFVSQAYADVTFYGSFGGDGARLLSQLDGVKAARGRTVSDSRDGERIIRAVSLTDGVNTPYIYTGRLPENAAECVLLKRCADAMGLRAGDYIGVEGKRLVITGLAASPEYIYMARNERTMMAQPALFGVVFVTEDFFPEGYNEIVALTGGGFSVNDASEKIGAFKAVPRQDQLNHYLYRSDLDEIRSFAYIFPFVFAALIAVVIYVALSRAVQTDRRQIGAMKALGAPDGRIIGIYLSQFCFAGLVGALLGCLAAMFICDGIIAVFSSMFEVPGLAFEIYPGLWAAAFAACVLLCVLSGLSALFPVLRLLPAQAMRPRTPKGGRVFLARAGFLWKRFSFNTRYALKNSLRNKGRFLAVVLGMCGSCALLAFSLGFYNSIGNTREKYFNGFANYDIIVSFTPLPLVLEHPALERMDNGYKALITPVNISGETYTLAVVEDGFDMVVLPCEALKNGVIIPEYFAAEWGVGVGDEIIIDDRAAAVSAVVPQYLGLTLYTGFDYINAATDEIPAVYNTVYGRSGNTAALVSYLKDNGFEFTTLDDDGASFNSIMESMSVLIWFMIACSVVLGFTVLYSVGLINLSAREYEYMFMGVMGYPHGSILAAHIKETLIQLVLAIPLGFLAGNILLESIKGEFSGGSFVIAAAIYPQSYVISALSVVGITALMALVTSRHIGGLDIVQGLKARDE